MTHSETTLIKAPLLPIDKAYISEFMESFPPNSLINKGKTGCGATSLVLDNDLNYVLAVPSVALAVNKAQWCEDRGIEVCIVKGAGGTSKLEYKHRTKDADIKDYVLKMQGQPMKFIVVYDSLNRVTTNIEPSEFLLMVDEAHNLVAKADSRGRGMNAVLQDFRAYQSTSFVTATPSDSMHLIPELSHLQRYFIEWHPDNLDIVNLNRHIVGVDSNLTLIDTTVGVCLEHLVGNRPTNAYIFVNSVTFILQVLKELQKVKIYAGQSINVTEQDVKLILGASSDNGSKLRLKVGKNWKIQDTLDAPKKLTFITSTAFEGADFYDNNGKVYAISNGKVNYSKLDVVTQLHQIAGRIRDSRHNTDIDVFTVPNTVASMDSKEAYMYLMNKRYNSAVGYVAGQLRALGTDIDAPGYDITASNFREEALKNPCLVVTLDGVPTLNTAFLASCSHNWEVAHQSFVYVTKLEDNVCRVLETELVDGSTQAFTDKPVDLPPDFLLLKVLGKSQGTSFTKAAQLYAETYEQRCVEALSAMFVEGKEYRLDQMLADIEVLYKVIPQAYKLIGPKGMKACRYRRKDMLVAMTDYKNNKEASDSVEAFLRLSLTEGIVDPETEVPTIRFTKSWYPNAELKKELQTIYDAFDLNKVASAGDIELYFEVKRQRKKLMGRMVWGYTIVDYKHRPLIENGYEVL